MHCNCSIDESTQKFHASNVFFFNILRLCVLHYAVYILFISHHQHVSVANGFVCRKRWLKGVKPPESRQPRDIGAIEKAMRNAQNRATTHIFEPVLGMVFDSRAEAYQFFNLYSWEVGFGIRFGSSARNRVNKYRTMQELVCEKEVNNWRSY